MTVVNRNTAATFWARVDRSNQSGCWEWTGRPNNWGYGVLWWSGRIRKAHRVSYALAFPDWDWTQCVLHRCDNPICVNPAHLFLGSQADNAADRDAKGRNVSHSGEAHYAAKLTAKLVQAIRNEPLSQRRTALKYAISQTTVWEIRKGLTWKSVR